MSRTMVPVALVLALLTGLALSQIAVVVSPTAAPIAMPSRDGTAWVRAFYDGMNRYLTAGDDSVLQLLAPGFRTSRHSIQWPETPPICGIGSMSYAKVPLHRTFLRSRRCTIMAIW